MKTCLSPLILLLWAIEVHAGTQKNYGLVVSGGTSAGVAEAIDEKKAVQDINYEQLRGKLLDEKQVLEVKISEQ